MKNEKLRTVTTADIFGEGKKKGKKSTAITTKDLPDALPNQPTGEEAKPIITTGKEGGNEEQKD